MKKIMLIVALLVLPVATTLAFHPNNDCDRCHVPHMAPDNDGVPLWSGLGIAATTSFTNYDSASLDATVGDPEGSTLLCLGCHDSSAGDRHNINAVGSSGDMSATHPMEFVYDSALAITDNELVDPAAAGSSTVVNGDGTIVADLLSTEAGKMNCVSCHEIHVNGLHSVTVDVGGVDTDFDMPHLVNMPGITYSLSYRGVASDPADYDLSYGVLCRTCHIK